MPSNEKELNCYLFDQLELIERLEIVAQRRKIFIPDGIFRFFKL